ncbi:MAG: hypothetical protein WCX82_01915 [archaeon]|jgi:hypothetical protein
MPIPKPRLRIKKKLIKQKTAIISERPEKSKPIKYLSKNSELNQRKYNREPFKSFEEKYFVEGITVLDNGYRMGQHFGPGMEIQRIPLDFPINGEELIITKKRTFNTKTGNYENYNEFARIWTEKKAGKIALRTEIIYSKKEIEKMKAEGKYYC